MKPDTFNIYVMSYMRSDVILSQDMFEYCTYVVRESEAKDYNANGVMNLITIPDNAVYDFMSTLYWIINNTPEDVIFIADDDIQSFVYRQEETRYIVTPDNETDTETITSEIERIAQLIVDLNIGLAYDQSNRAPYAYDKEFQFKGMPGHMRWINKKALKATYDPHDPASSDIDMAMQELLHNRIVLQPKYLCVRAGMDTNKGIVEDRAEHLILVESMKNKWGRYYGYDYRKNTAKINVQR